MTPTDQTFAKHSPLNHLHFPVPPLSNPGDYGYSYTDKSLELILSCGFSLFCNWCTLKPQSLIIMMPPQRAEFIT